MKKVNQIDKPFCVVFNRLPDADGATFVEVEDLAGQSLEAKWSVRADGRAELVFACHEAPASKLRLPVAIVNVERPGNIEWLAEPTPDDGAMLYAEPQPPELGGEPVMRLEAEKLLGGDGEYAVDFVKAGWLMSCRETGGTFYLYSQDHVARLQAEVERLKGRAVTGVKEDVFDIVCKERDGAYARTAALEGLLLEFMDEPCQLDNHRTKLRKRASEALAEGARGAAQHPDTARLDFMLLDCRKVVVERVPGALEVYVEEGFMSDRRYGAITVSGDCDNESEQVAKIYRHAIDLAMAEVRND